MKYDRVELKELCSLSQGLQIPIAERFRDDGPNRYFYITVQFLKDNSDKYFIENPPERVKCNSEDILVVRTGNTGQIITGVDGCFHNNFFKVEPNEKIYPKFLYYTLKSPELYTRMRNVASGTTILDLKHSAFLGLDIYLPDLANQKKIANILDLIDQKIKNCESINNNLEQFSQNLFKKWFIDFDLKNDFGICEDFKDSSLGEIPQSWEIRTVGELSDVKGRIGWRGYTTNDLVDDGPWVIGGKEITSGFIDFSSAKHLTREKYEESPEIMLKDKDLIIAKTGTIGPIAMFYEGFGEATLNPNVGLIRSKNISPALLLTFFKTPRAQYYLNEFTTSSVQPAINQTTIKQLEVALPSDISLLNKISLIFDEINDIQYNLIEGVKKLSILRDTLLPKLMSGEVDVSKINCDSD